MNFNNGQRYECKECGWSGNDPSVSDLSELNELGAPTHRHIFICRVCFSDKLCRADVSPRA